MSICITTDPLREAVWNTFFENETDVGLLPSSKLPRLFFEDQGPWSRWQASGFYPAFSKKARLLRLGVQAVAFVGIIPRRRCCGVSFEFQRFMQQAGFEGCSADVMIGTPGPTQKAIARIRVGPRVVAYLKFGISPDAQQRVRQEGCVLKQMPEGLAPAYLAAGPLNAGEAVLMAPLEGTPVPANRPVPFEFLLRLKRNEKHPFTAHPWILRMQSAAGICPADYPELSEHSWPVVIMHGDFAPWNLIRCSEGRGQKSGGRGLITDSTMTDNHPRCLYAIDWESGTMEGFPFIDAAHYVIQSACNLYRWTAEHAAEESVRTMIRLDGNLSQAAAAELTRLTVQWLIFRDGLTLNGAGTREEWYRALLARLSDRSFK